MGARILLAPFCTRGLQTGSFAGTAAGLWMQVGQALAQGRRVCASPAGFCFDSWKSSATRAGIVVELTVIEISTAIEISTLADHRSSHIPYKSCTCMGWICTWCIRMATSWTATWTWTSSATATCRQLSTFCTCGTHTGTSRTLCSHMQVWLTGPGTCTGATSADLT